MFHYIYLYLFRKQLLMTNQSCKSFNRYVFAKTKCTIYIFRLMLHHINNNYIGHSKFEYMISILQNNELLYFKEESTILIFNI